MKRAIGLALLIIACILGFLTIKGTLPFMPIFGHSMEPTLESGSLLTIKPVNPGDVKVGDIIIYNVPAMVREYYNYPPVVSHRVIEIKTVPSLGFRTKGDNTGEDPFTIRPMDIRGTVGSQIPYLGLPLLFFQSQQGLIFVIVGLVLLTIFLYGGELLRGGTLVHRSIFAPVINEEKRANRMLTRKIESTEKKMDTTEQALVKFSSAITEYAQHLASHTSAVQGLAEASHELKRGAAEQNRVLMSLVQNMGKAPLGQETTAPRIEPPTPEKPPARPQKIAGEIEPVLPPRFQKTFEETFKPFHAALNKPVPPGCARKQPEPSQEALNTVKEIATAFDRFQSRQELTEEALIAQKKISNALVRLHRKLDTMNGQE
jgi:signal peptidase